MVYHAFNLKKSTSLNLGDKITHSFIKSNYFIKNYFLSTLSRIFFNNFREIAIERILILRMGSMGDTVTALPAFNAIRNKFQDAHIDLLTNKTLNGKARVTEILPEKFFQNIYNYGKFVDRQTVDLLKKNKYDLYIELPTYKASLYFEIRSFLLANRIKSKAAIGWHVSSDLFLRKNQQQLFRFDTNRIRLLNILGQYGITYQDTGWLLKNNFIELPDYDDILKSDSNLIKIIALVPGAGLPDKKWDSANFQKLTELFSQQNYKIVFVGGKEDYLLCDKIIRNTPGCINLCGKLSVLETAAVLSKCILVLSNDTGPMHLAYAAGTSVIALFGNRDYEGKWDPPLNGGNIVIRSKDKDVSKITVGEVISASYRLLLFKNGNSEV